MMCGRSRTGCTVEMKELYAGCKPIWGALVSANADDSVGFFLIEGGISEVSLDSTGEFR